MELKELVSPLSVIRLVNQFINTCLPIERASVDDGVCTSGGEIRIDEECGEVAWENKRREEEVPGGKHSPGRPICGIVGARDITEVKRDIGGDVFKTVIDPAKDEVGGPVATPPISPAIDNALIVTEDAEVVERLLPASIENGECE
jgi:hypothetical protein